MRVDALWCVFGVSVEGSCSANGVAVSSDGTINVSRVEDTVRCKLGDFDGISCDSRFSGIKTSLLSPAGFSGRKVIVHF